ALSRRNPAAAGDRFQAILDLTLADDALAAAAKGRQRTGNTNPTAPTTPTSVSAITAQVASSRISYSAMIRIAVGLDRINTSAGNQYASWRPQDFGQARLAALAWLLKFANEQQAQQTREQLIGQLGRRANSEDATNRDLWDWIYLQSLNQQ